MNIAVFASGKGTNFSAIAKAIKNRTLKANLALLICDNPNAYVIERARCAGVKTALVRREDFNSKKDFEAQIIQQLKQNNIDLIVLAGFMRILSPEFVSHYKYKILNIHPALLPSFKGAEAIKDAFNYGAKITGVTVHLVDEKMDHGPIILQKAIEIKEGQSLELLEGKIHRIEHKLYPEAIKLVIDGRMKISGRKVKIRTL